MKLTPQNHTVDESDGYIMNLASIVGRQCDRWLRGELPDQKTMPDPAFIQASFNDWGWGRRAKK